MHAFSFFSQSLQLSNSAAAALSSRLHPHSVSPPPPHLLPPSCRYKMTCEYTWPHHLMSSDREAVETVVNQHGFKDDVAYGKSKLFVRTPRTLFTLEQERAALIPILVLFLQKVSAPSDLGHMPTSVLTTDWTCRPRGFFFGLCDQTADRPPRPAVVFQTGTHRIFRGATAVFASRS